MALPAWEDAGLACGPVKAMTPGMPWPPDQATESRWTPDGEQRGDRSQHELAAYRSQQVRKSTATEPTAEQLSLPTHLERHGRHVVRRLPFGLHTGDSSCEFHSTSPGPRADGEALTKRQLEGIQVLLSLSNATLVSRSRADARRGARVLAPLRDPALRAAMALIVSNVVSGGLGFVFWAMTAHYQKASGVGSVAAEVSAITFLASVGSLNLINVFARFIPEAGWHARRMILISYSGVVLAGSLCAIIFFLTPLASRLIIGGATGRLALASCVLLNSIFMIQDGGLVGFGRSGWVPVENTLVAVARLVLLPLIIMRTSAPIAILWSWALPMAAAVLVVNAFIICRLAGRRQTRQKPKLPPVRQLGRFVAIESVTTAIAAAVSAFLPALVTLRLGASEGGYFYVPWIITTMASLLFTSILISMVREAVASPQHAASTINRSLRLVLLAMIVGMIGCFFLSRLVLAPMGADFAAYGTPLLRWLGLALPAITINLLFWSFCLVRRHPWPVLAVNLTTSAVIIGGVMLLRQGADVSRVGMIYCLSQWIVAVAVAVPALKALRLVRAE
jgi:O-antigen/teichoic acid export membrane protein